MEVKIKNKGEEKKYFLSPGETLFEMLIRQENYFLSFCGGRGMCGKCKIQFLSPPPMPHAEERKFLTPEELRKGIRLACLARPKEDCVISILFEKEKMHRTTNGVSNAILIKSLVRSLSILSCICFFCA